MFVFALFLLNKNAKQLVFLHYNEGSILGEILVQPDQSGKKVAMRGLKNRQLFDRSRDACGQEYRFASWIS